MLERLGPAFTRQTMGQWIEHAALLLQSVHSELRAKVRQSGFQQMDGEEIEPHAIPEGCVISLRLQPTIRVPEFESEGDAYEAVVKGHLRPMAGYQISGRSWARNAMGGTHVV
jgi:hypothetical protein